MNKVMKSLVSAVVLAAALAGPSMSATILNGSFEQDAGKAQDGDAFSSLAGSSGGASWSVFDSLPGWTTVSGPGIEIQTKNTVSVIDAQDGQHYVELDSHKNSAMQQTVTFTSTGRYLLSFFFSPRDQNAASNIIDYSLIGAASPFANLLSGSVTGPSNVPLVTAVGLWTEVTAEFVVKEIGSYNLRFAANGENNSLGGFVDNVSIAAVPVPAGGLLLIGALGGLATLRRRKAV
jgi:hypothetical protein